MFFILAWKTRFETHARTGSLRPVYSPLNARLLPQSNWLVGPSSQGHKSELGQYYRTAVENRFAPLITDRTWMPLSETQTFMSNQEMAGGGGGDSPEESVKARRNGGGFYTFSCINENALWSRNNSSRDVGRPACSGTQLGIKNWFLVHRLPVCVWMCVSPAPERVPVILGI
jgi:hypothetical protein